DKKWEDKKFLSEDILKFFHSADHVCINVEGALLDLTGIENKSQFFHAMNPQATTLFDKIGADIYSIGNNHIMDAGIEGVKSTVKIAKGKGVYTIGAGENIDQASTPVYIDSAGGIGIFNVSYMKENTPATKTQAGFFAWNDMEEIQKRIKEIKSKCRWCIVVAHGGDEFSPIPNTYTRDRYMEYLQFGADVVVGHHPHVVENYELFGDGKMIFYSLGNFIFDTNYQRSHINTDVGVLLKLEFSQEKLEFNAIGIKLNREKGKIEKSELPDIFENVNETEYEILKPLFTKAFIEEEKRKMIYLEPEKYSNATLKEWEEYFYSDTPDGFVKGEHMDLSISYPVSKHFTKGEWQKSKLEKVKNYLLKHI
ncbi:MAG: CapA family protein, partial [Clostridia bacterium]|nr:CapA family protein [Clostridia bacterium]